MVNLIGMYAGSFDPITLGHLDIISRSSKLVDKLIIAIGHNPNKNKDSLFTAYEKLEIIQECIQDFSTDIKKKLEIEIFKGLLIDFAEKKQAKIIIRGIRALSDFDFEFTLAGVNSKLNHEIETIFFMASENKQFISSRFVKEVASLEGALNFFVPPLVIDRLKKKYHN